MYGYALLELILLVGVRGFIDYIGVEMSVVLILILTSYDRSTYLYYLHFEYYLIILLSGSTR